MVLVHIVDHWELGRLRCHYYYVVQVPMVVHGICRQYSVLSGNPRVITKNHFQDFASLSLAHKSATTAVADHKKA